MVRATEEMTHSAARTTAGAGIFSSAPVTKTATALSVAARGMRMAGRHWRDEEVLAPRAPMAARAVNSGPAV